MSHLLATPFNKPSPLDLPRNGRPLSPPETDFGFAGHHHQASKSAPVALGVEFDPKASFSSATTETPQPRKISYLNSGPKESREKVVQRGFKWLVVVLPPSSFAQEHGHLGNTLSSGSPSRLVHGSLMPLYPTMGGQLGAIAREYNFPSISGLCIYLHTDYGGISITPRVSDDSWPLLWSHLFDPRTPSPPLPHVPIGGKIEFDIDLRKARWYNTWLTAPRKDFVDVPVSVTPTHPRSVSHWRGDSRTSFPDDQQDEVETVSLSQQAKPSRLNRHIPRKLSLLDRFDASSVRSGSKLVPRNLSPPSPAPPIQVFNALSPIVQEDEPKTARKHLDQLVTSWRASASQTASPLAATGQTSLDPVNLPNSFPLDDSSPADSHPPSELNLSDFGWSVSSVGPPDEDDLESIASQWRAPSVHLDRRIEGSVCLTPSTCTSWGPRDDDLDLSPISNIIRLPSPDMAYRMLDDVPPTPSTCTSWGPPSYPNSPTGAESFSRALSIDLGHRGEFSRPVTPSTATSWGPPESEPPSPATPYYVRSPDVGERGFDYDVPEITAGPRPWQLVWPYYGEERDDEVVVPPEVQPAVEGEVPQAATGEPWQMVWPYVNIPREVQEGPVAGAAVIPDDVIPRPISPNGGQPWPFVWPYTDANNMEGVHVEGGQLALAHGSAEPWRLVWPYTEDRQVPTAQIELSVPSGKTSAYPYLTIYPPVYPNFDIYPGQAGSAAVPHFVPEPVVNSSALSVTSRRNDSPPATRITPISVKLSTYPSLCIYSPVYPYNLDSIYPSTSTQAFIVHDTTKAPRLQNVTVKLASTYPCLDIYPPVYPDNLRSIYPCVSALPSIPEVRTSLHQQSEKRRECIQVSLQAYYPFFDIYPPVYPNNLRSIYPSASSVLTIPEAKTSSHQQSEKQRERIQVSLDAHYPFFDIYPPVYPSNLETVYPSTELRSIKIKENGDHPDKLPSPQIVATTVTLEARYPVFDIYPSVYPFNLEKIYPDVDSSKSSPERVASVSISVYPNLIIYPEVPATHDEAQKDHSAVEVGFDRSRRPTLAVNVAGLPPPRRVGKNVTRVLNAKLAQRSNLDVPPVPPLPQGVSRMRPISPITREPMSGERIGMSLPVHLPFAYPTVCPYPPVYPEITIYPPTPMVEVVHSVKPVEASIKLQAKYPNIEPYPSVYPYFDIYPAVDVHRSIPQPKPAAPVQSVTLSTPPSRRRPRYTHLELHNQVFGPEAPRPKVASPRQLPTPPAVRTSPGTTPSPSPSPPARHPVTHHTSRSSTLIARYKLPSPPINESPSRPPRQLPAIPGGSPGTQGLRTSPPRVYGLPSTPSPSRRLSTPGFMRSNPSFSPLPRLAEPRIADAVENGFPKARSRPLPRLNGHESIPEDVEIPTRGFSSATLPERSRVESGANLSRTMSLPSRPLPRTTRSSMVVDSSTRGSPFSGSDSPPMRLAMSTLAQFPPPPRAPLPSTPNSRPVSKLDRSKYPFV